MIFLSTHKKAVDCKGRAVIPKDFRDILKESQCFVGFRSYKYAAIDCYTIEKMEKFSSNLEATLDPFSNQRDQIQTSVFADAILIKFDKEGRAVIPEILLQHAEIKEELAFVGLGATFQLWNPVLFDIYQDENRVKLRSSKDASNIKE